MFWPWGISLAAAGGAGAHLVLWAQGERTFVTHPLSVLALGGAAIAVAWLAGRAAETVRPLVLALAGALAAYLALGAWATAAPDSVSAGLWSAGWIPVNALLTALGLGMAGFRRPSWGLLAVSGACTVAAAFLVRPVAPFTGIATAAPDGWEASPLASPLLLLWNLALVAATMAVFVAATRASVLDRRRLARAAAVASSGPCLVVVCLALAVLRNPGDVDPETGSVAYTCAIGLLSVVAGWAVGRDDRAVVRLLAGLWAAALVIVGGVALAGPVTEQNVALGVLVIAGLTVIAAAATVLGVVRFEAWSQQPAPRAVARTLPGLSPRENDVLAAVARGATNGAVAADLFLSERTIEQHLRSIFDKLELGEHGGSNRRVRAAAMWWALQSDAAEQDAVG